MANIKFSALPLVTVALDAMEFAVNDAGTSKKLTRADVLGSADIPLEATKKLVLNAGVDDTHLSQISASPHLARLTVAGFAGMEWIEGTTDQTEIDTIVGAPNVLATTAKEGFIYIPTCAGTPTGVPVGRTGKVAGPLFDTTNDIVYFYNSGWKGVGVS